MPAREIDCPGCGIKVFQVAGYWDNVLMLDKGKVEIGVHVSQVDAYTTQSGFKVHKCQKK